MFDLLKSLAEMAIIVSAVVTMTYYLFIQGVYEDITMLKSNINKGVSKGVINFFMWSIIGFISFMLCMDLYGNIKEIEKYFCQVWVYSGLIYFFLYYILLHFFSYRRNILRSNKIHVNSRKLTVFFLILCISLFGMHIVSFKIYFCNLKLDYNHIFSMSWGSKQYGILIFIIIQLLIPYIFMILDLGLSFFLYKFFSLNKVKLISDLFEQGEVTCYVLYEDEKEVTIKCDNSYPITVKKDKIDAYININTNMLSKFLMIEKLKSICKIPKILKKISKQLYCQNELIDELRNNPILIIPIVIIEVLIGMIQIPTAMIGILILMIQISIAITKIIRFLFQILNKSSNPLFKLLKKVLTLIGEPLVEILSLKAKIIEIIKNAS